MDQVPGEVVGEEQGLMEVVRPLDILMVCEVDSCHHQCECLVPWLQAGGGGDSPDGGQQGSLSHKLQLQAGGEGGGLGAGNTAPRPNQPEYGRVLNTWPYSGWSGPHARPACVFLA